MDNSNNKRYFQISFRYRVKIGGFNKNIFRVLVGFGN